MPVSIPKQCDVAIIGGGPTGSTAAGNLAKLGHHVVLLERVKHPRNTVGESLIPHFWRYTDEIGASQALEAEGFVAKSGGLSLWGDQLRRLRFRDFGYQRPALHVERDVFDNILLRTVEQAGVEVFEQATVTRIDDIDGGRPSLRYLDAAGNSGTLTARYVIDASGQTGLLANQIKTRVFDQAVRFSSFWGYYRKSRYLTYDGDVHTFGDKFTHRPATLVSTIGDWGWAWQIVLRDSVSVGIILPRARRHEMRANSPAEREEKFLQNIASVPLMGGLLHQEDFISGSLQSLRDYAYRAVNLTAGNCYLAGDAAAFVDPINSIGIVFGIFAGRAAAQAIAGSLKDTARADFHRSFYEAQYGARLALFRLLAVPDARDHLSKEEISMAKDAINASSQTEQQLMALQATLSAREGALNGLFDELGINQRPPVSSLDWRSLAI